MDARDEGGADAGVTAAKAHETQAQIADRFVFLLQHHAQFSRDGHLRASCKRTPPGSAEIVLCERDVWNLLLLALPRPAHLQIELSVALQDVGRAVLAAAQRLGHLRVSPPAADALAQVCSWIEHVRTQPRVRLRFFDELEDLARTQRANNALAALRQELESAGHRHLAESVPGSLIPAVSFHNLCALEAAWLARRGGESIGGVRVRQAGTQREPRVEVPARDYLGLALSGGGIRSATFNLGVLQALEELKLLDDVDYVSSVSGGGYVGGFWTAFRHANRGESFPRPGGDPDDGREHAAIRHLREFSRFLIPRVGLGQLETWNAVVVTFGGAVASLGAITAAVALVFYIWQGLTTGLAALPVDTGAGVFAGVTWIVLVLLQLALGHVGKVDRGEQMSRWTWVIPALAAVGTWAAWQLLGRRPWGFDVAIGNRDCPTACIFAPAAAWMGCVLQLYLVRGFCSRWSGLRFGTALDRTIGRLLSWTTLVCSVGAIWLLAHWVFETQLALGAGTLGATSVALFVWLNDWLKAPVQETHGSVLAGSLLRRLKPVLPQLAANTSALLMFVGVAILVQQYGSGDDLWLGRSVSALTFILALFFFDPARTGLHDFYRARISRCFLGAARAKADASCAPRPRAVTAEQEKDDITLGELRRSYTGADESPHVPLHLICCAANNLSGDVLGNLYRGARSAALSPFGISVGSVAAPLDRLRLSAALTASAAAFNSQMGPISIDLGPAVAFVMCTLNLRLGLWVPHPANPKAHLKLAPGWHFYLEALGLSRSDQITSPGFLAESSLAIRAASYLDRYGSQLHLSDGGHFENLGLYELVRRHCRYIIACDASADPDLQFTDLGNAIRRVREDFGVEIEIDVSPLHKGDNGLSAQHSVLGIIHYGPSSKEKGTLIYLKSTLTGDEPLDVLEYRRRSPHFPHDTTGDQFYDEAQWESYRRLGQHAASSALQVFGSAETFERLAALAALEEQRRHPGITHERPLTLVQPASELAASEPASSEPVSKPASSEPVSKPAPSEPAPSEPIKSGYAAPDPVAREPAAE